MGEALGGVRALFNRRTALAALALCAWDLTPHAADAKPMRNRYRHGYLKVQAAQLVNAAGMEVRLRGLNLGGWLVTETWMNGFTDSKDTPEQSGHKGHALRSTEESLIERFGPGPALRLVEAWRDHWITTRDLDLIASWGFNLVRVPFSWRALYPAGPDGAPDLAGDLDFSRLDWIVSEAAERGLYTIPVLHVWPEQRTHYEKIALPEGAAILAQMADLWRRIAAHYRGNGAIAGFDIINEFPGNWGVQSALAKAIREGDPDRVLFVEGFTLDEFAQRQTDGEFTNSVFSEHLYKADPLTNEEISAAVAKYDGRDFPIYVGEFLAADFHFATALMENAGVSWSPWTYKTVDMGDWGAINYHSDLKVDIQLDPYERLLDVWSSQLSAWTKSGAPRNFWVNNSRLPRTIYKPLNSLHRSR